MTTTLITETVQVWRAPVVADSYNQQVRSWPGTQVATGRASVQPRFGLEDIQDRQTTTETFRLISDDAAIFGLLTTDRIVWRGRTLEVDGVPQMWYHRQVWHHMEANLRVVTG